jgi:hypothetical protein
VELIRCRRLVKGYSDTHARGLSKFDRVLAATARIAARPDAADWCRRLREAALKDEEGKALDGAIKTIRALPDKLPSSWPKYPIQGVNWERGQGGRVRPLTRSGPARDRRPFQ